MDFDIYNPYGNQDVTSYYVSTIEMAIRSSLGSVSYVERLSKVNPLEQRGVVVVSPIDVKAARKCGYATVVLWVQGLLSEESFMRNGSRIRCIVLDSVVKGALTDADLILFVSKSMVDYYEKKYRMQLKNWFVMPCFNESIPENASSGFGNAEKEPVFLYAGGMAPWQCFEETVELFKAIERSVPESKLIVLTREKNKAITTLGSAGISRYEVDEVNKNEFNQRVQNVKFGFCLRRDNPVNNVATPTKLSSYIANGIIPIYSESIHDFSQTARNSKYCISVPSVPMREESIQSIIEACSICVSREELYSDFAHVFGEYYSRESYVKSLARKIRQLVA